MQANPLDEEEVTPARNLALRDVMRFVITTLVKWAQDRSWGELKITVQDGQIIFVTEHRSYRDQLPKVDGQVEPEDHQLRQLVVVK